MDFISVREAAGKWHISARRVQKLCGEGRVTGARRFGRSWMIPEDAEKPGDPRKSRAQWGSDMERGKNKAAATHYYSGHLKHKLNGQHTSPATKAEAPSGFGKTTTVKALDFYLQAKDYQRLLSLDLSPVILEEIGGVPFSAIALNIARGCPAGIKKRNILSMLRVAWALLTAGLQADFNILMEELRVMLDAENSDDNLLGEWMLLSSYKNYPRLDEMTAVLKKATPLFKGRCSQVILPAAPWCFGSHSALAEFHLTPGQADREAEALEGYLTLYIRLTNGHGSGADALYRAELAYQRGNLAEAELLAYKAVFLAESKQQSVVQLGATLVLAHLALHNADTARWQQAISSMERASFPDQDNFVTRMLLDIVRGMLLNELQDQKSIAGWLQQAEFSQRRLLPAMASGALFAHLSYLMHNGEYARLIGTAQALLPRGLGPLRDTLFYLTLAMGHMARGNRDKASELARFAAQQGLPDGLVLPFAAYSWVLGQMIDKLVKQEYPAIYEDFCASKERFIAGWRTLHSAMSLDELPPDLTRRENEVARLAAAGLRNSEIAARLMVTENTVRFHLRAIFQKLDIDRRARLAEKLK